MIPGLSTIKTWLIAGLAVVASVLAALLGFAKAGREKDRRKGVEDAREVEQKAADAMIEGLTKTEKARHEKIPTDPDYDIFSDPK